MQINKAEYVKSCVRAEHYPTDGLPEMVFAGRSNVGKSSFINSLTNRKQLARVSSRPGKTQTLNFYNINDMMYLVDVPGYGYAKVNRSLKESFGRMIEEYLVERDELILGVLLVDYRHKPTQEDIAMYSLYKYYEIPTLVIGTVTTGEPGTQATASITGTAPNYILNLTIPQGPTGPTG